MNSEMFWGGAGIVKKKDQQQRDKCEDARGRRTE